MTGSDSGIGQATALALADAGIDVGITWHSDEEGAQKTADGVRERGRYAFVAHFDATELGAAAGVIDDLAGELGGLDVFVNNAGGGRADPFLDLTHRGLARGRGAQSRRRLRRHSGGRAAHGLGRRRVGVSSPSRASTSTSPASARPPMSPRSTGSAGSSRRWPRSSASTGSPSTRSLRARSRRRSRATMRRMPSTPIAKASRSGARASRTRSRTSSRSSPRRHRAM